jgi:hypothetical protein
VAFSWGRHSACGRLPPAACTMRDGNGATETPSSAMVGQFRGGLKPGARLGPFEACSRRPCVAGNRACMRPFRPPANRPLTQFATYFSGFVFAGIPQRSLRNSSRLGNGGLKGRLHGRKPRSSGSPGLRRGRQFAHQRNCRRVVPRRGFHPLSWAEGPCGQARLPAARKAKAQRRAEARRRLNACPTGSLTAMA